MDKHPTFSIGSVILDQHAPSYIIAEIGVNHEGDIELAKELISQAKEGGAHAAKFQTYKAEKLASRNSPSYWDTNKEPTTSQYELFKKFDSFGPKEYEELAQHCEACDIDFLSTPFDADSVDSLSPLMKCFKIASADLTNTLLLRKVASLAKPVMLSVGSSTNNEIVRAVETLERAGASEIALLHCVLNYPTPDENGNLGQISKLMEVFPHHLIGYSDHTLPNDEMTALSCAYTLGARILEKHFTHDKSLPGNDHYHAMDHVDLRRYVSFEKKIRRLLGTAKSRLPLPSESISRLNARRSLVLTRELPKGHILKKGDLTAKRPGTGITADNLDELIGTALKDQLPEDHVLTWEDIKPRGVENQPKVVAIVQARMGSTRLPGKMLMELCNTPIIQWVHHRLANSKEIDEIVFALPDTQENNDLEEFLTHLGATVFRGSELDVLDRITTAARCYEADIVVRICADNPLLDAGEIDKAIKHFLDSDTNYVFNHIPFMDNRYPDGLGAEVTSRATLEKLNTIAVTFEEREHAFNALWKREDEFKIETLRAPTELRHSYAKLDVDIPNDLKRLEAILDRIAKAGADIDPKTLKTGDILQEYGEAKDFA